MRVLAAERHGRVPVRTTAAEARYEKLARERLMKARRDVVEGVDRLIQQLEEDRAEAWKRVDGLRSWGARLVLENTALKARVATLEEQLKQRPVTAKEGP